MTSSPDDLERSALGKASWRLLPLIALGYGVAYMDRVNISFAYPHMKTDLHFSATVYGLGAGLFFISYALLEVPSNLLLVRFGARRWISRIMMTWGVLAMAMMLVRTPWQFYLVRFLLGVAEAGFFPGVVYYLTLWFPSGYRGRAISRFYIAWPISSIVMGGLAGVLLGLNGRLGLAGWQWLFLVEGAPAVLLGAWLLFVLPNRPSEAKWLTGSEKDWIERRLAAEAAVAAAGNPQTGIRWLADPRVIAVIAVNFLILGSFYAFTLSAPDMLRSVGGFSDAKAGLIVALGGVTGLAAMALNGWHADRSGERFLHLVLPLVLMGLAFAAFSQTRGSTLLTAAYVLAVTANAGVQGVFWLMPTSVLPPRAVAAGLATVNAIGQTGSFLAPFLWGIARDRTGSYHLGLTLLPIPFFIAAALVLALRQGERLRAPAVVVAPPG